MSEVEVCTHFARAVASARLDWEFSSCYRILDASIDALLGYFRGIDEIYGHLGQGYDQANWPCRWAYLY